MHKPLWNRAIPRSLGAIIHEEEAMPAKSKAQQKAAGAALSAKRGETPKSELKGASRSMVDSMSEKQLEELAHTKRKPLPEHKGKSR
jgi:NAD/NADP transhydrogenase alpha subunit